MSFENISYFGLRPEQYGQYGNENHDSDFNIEKREMIKKYSNQLIDILSNYFEDTTNLDELIKK